MQRSSSRPSRDVTSETRTPLPASTPCSSTSREVARGRSSVGEAHARGPSVANRISTRYSGSRRDASRSLCTGLKVTDRAFVVVSRKNRAVFRGKAAAGRAPCISSLDQVKKPRCSKSWRSPRLSVGAQAAAVRSNARTSQTPVTADRASMHATTTRRGKPNSRGCPSPPLACGKTAVKMANELARKFGDWPVIFRLPVGAPRQ